MERIRNQNYHYYEKKIIETRTFFKNFQMSILKVFCEEALEFDWESKSC